MRYDFKHLIVSALENSVYDDSKKPRRLIVCTPFGIVNGTPPSQDEGYTTIHALVEKARDARKRLEQAQPKAAEHISAEDCLVLKDVTIISGTVRVDLPELALFYSDICGFSLGNFLGITKPQPSAEEKNT